MSMTQGQFEAAIADGRWADLLKESFFRDPTTGNVHQRVAVGSAQSTFGSAGRGAAFDPSVAGIVALILSGTDANIDLQLDGKGTGGIDLVKLAKPLTQGRKWHPLLLSGGYVAKAASDVTGLNDPFGLCVLPSGLIAVSNSNGGNVSIVNPAKGTVLATVTVGTSPREICFSATSNRLYVANFTSGTVSVINPDNWTVVATLTVGTNPLGCVWIPSTNTVYVSNSAADSVSVIDCATAAVTATITTGIGDFPNKFVFCPLNGNVYLTCNNETTVKVISPSNNTVSTSITVGTAPGGICYSHRNERIYVANVTSGNISVINPNTNTVTATITASSGVDGLCINAATDLLYAVVGSGNTVLIFNPATTTQYPSLTGQGSGPRGIAFVPHLGGVAFCALSDDKLVTLS
ncbi:MAG: YncE family protein [Verrucomicrobiota bacterium]|nr:YncE family protein [Verrucomicrobiota bacterium]